VHFTACRELSSTCGGVISVVVSDWKGGTRECQRAPQCCRHPPH
jgi:hypothetical protein